MTKLIEKYIVITNNNREPLSKYCEENGILTCSQRTVRRMLADFSDILAVGFDSRGEAGYTREVTKVYIDVGYEEITMKDLPQNMGVVEDEPEIVEEVDTEPKPQPCKRDMVIKLNEMYTARDSLDLVIEQTEQLLKNLL